VVAYVVGNESIHDQAKYEEYRTQVRPTLALYGGRVLSAGPIAEVLEGEPKALAFVIEFESLERAKEWYSSPEYQAIIGLRHAAAEGWLALARELQRPPTA
jgi:uncharacterized protein (DUF1330 family)